LTDFGKFLVRLVVVLVIIRFTFALIFTGGLALNSVDVEAAVGIAKSAEILAQKEGSCQWLPFYFSGMPSYQMGWYPGGLAPLEIRNYLIGTLGVVLFFLVGAAATHGWSGPIVCVSFAALSVWAGFGVEAFSIAVFLFILHELPE